MFSSKKIESINSKKSKSSKSISCKEESGKDRHEPNYLSLYNFAQNNIPSMVNNEIRDEEKKNVKDWSVDKVYAF